ncbi:hypothetical protein Micbo1qcDRAFT_180279 [Microdochium bolleyi]|uniref:Uncharacterized protein n=1 Tax=Microdochium bolleyi TaxID=196109 RepID=A0A136IM77_9PEZI|nr:hypothetical protein Micbo1qcDRAFT_180279 [Microdochium bolleyi]
MTWKEPLGHFQSTSRKCQATGKQTSIKEGAGPSPQKCIVHSRRPLQDERHRHRPASELDIKVRYGFPSRPVQPSQAKLTSPSTIPGKHARCADCGNKLVAYATPGSIELLPFIRCDHCVRDFVNKPETYTNIRLCMGIHHHGAFARMLPGTWFDSPEPSARCRICVILDVKPIHERYYAVRARFAATRAGLAAISTSQHRATEIHGVGYVEDEPITGDFFSPEWIVDRNPLRLPSIYEDSSYHRRSQAWWKKVMAGTPAPLADSSDAHGGPPVHDPVPQLTNPMLVGICWKCGCRKHVGSFYGFRKRPDGICNIPDTCLDCRGLFALYESIPGEAGSMQRRLMRTDTGEITTDENHGMVPFHLRWTNEQM